jgi:hypothetical protein
MKTCFVIAPIGEENSEIRKNSDQVLKHLITPGVKPLGYEPVRADQIEKSGIITQQIMERIAKSELVLADLTGPNANVLYELSLRHALRLPFIQIVRKDSKIPFDVSANRTIHYDLTDPDSVSDCVGRINTQAQDIQAGKIDIDNPISVSEDIRKLRDANKDSQNVTMERVLQEIIELKSEVGTASRNKSPEEILPPDYLLYVLKFAQRHNPDFFSRRDEERLMRGIDESLMVISEVQSSLLDRSNEKLTPEGWIAMRKRLEASADLIQSSAKEFRRRR